MPSTEANVSGGATGPTVPVASSGASLSELPATARAKLAPRSKPQTGNVMREPSFRRTNTVWWKRLWCETKR